MNSEKHFQDEDDTSTENNLITLPEQEGTFKFANDINQKINSLESHFEKLSHVFSHSQTVFQEQVKEAQAKLGTKLDQAAKSLQLHDRKISGLASKQETFAEELTSSMAVIGNKLKDTSDAISDQTKKVDSLTTEHEQLKSLHENLEKISANQSKELSALAASTKQHLNKNEENISLIKSLLEEHQGGLDNLLENYQAVDGKAKQLSSKLSEVDIELQLHQKKTHKHFKTTAITGGLLATVIIAGIATLQFYPVTVPDNVQTQINDLAAFDAGLSSQNAATESKINQLSGEQEGLLSRLKSLATDFSLLGSQVSSNHEKVLSQQTETNATVAALDTNLSEMSKTVDNLDYRVNGPGIGDETKLEPSITLQDINWVNSQSADNYVIQLMGVYRYNNMISFINKNAHVIDTQVSYTQGQHLGKPWYNLYYGSYTSFDAAQAALDAMPLRLRANNPYIRSIATIQR